MYQLQTTILHHQFQKFKTYFLLVIEVFESMIHDAERQFTITILWVICMHTVKRNITSLSQDCMYYSDSSTMYLWNIFKLAEYSVLIHQYLYVQRIYCLVIKMLFVKAFLAVKKMVVLCPCYKIVCRIVHTNNVIHTSPKITTDQAFLHILEHTWSCRHSQQ